MSIRQRFPSDILDQIQKEKIIGIRAGADSTHKVIGVWAVVVEGRVFIRSWGINENGWWRTFLKDPQGILTVGTKEFQIRTIQTRSEQIKDQVSTAYKEKYNTPGSLQYVKDMSRKRSRNTTTELVPL